MSRYARQAKTY